MFHALELQLVAERAAGVIPQVIPYSWHPATEPISHEESSGQLPNPD